jgi:succinoglycan biosynthesis protein ExoA
MDISIVVACRNENGHIGLFLDSLLRQEFGGLSWEGIIADGMSEDGTRQIIQEYCAKWPQLRMVDNPGFFVSNGLNRAILASRGEIILRLDAHTRYAPDYCRRCVETLRTTGADNTGGPVRTAASGRRGSAIAAAFHSPFSTGGAKFHDETYEGWVDTVPYGCWRRETLLNLGPFDENLIRNQDDEMNLRLQRAGGKIWQNPAIVSWYSPRTNLVALFLQYFQYGFWKMAVIRRHRLPASWRHLVPCAFVLVHLSMASALLIAELSRAGTAAWAELWILLIGVYAFAVAIASVDTARRRGWGILPYLPAVFATYHFSYGLGFLFGIFLHSRRLGGPRGLPLLTRITR